MSGNIGETISLYRQMKKLTQAEFAMRLGVTPQAVSKWECGNGMPDVSLIEGICRILQISANTLLGLEDKVVENGDVAAEKEIRNNMLAEPLVLEFGENIIPYVVEGLKTNYVNECRKKLAKRTGMLLPILRLRDNISLPKNAYQIISYDNILFEAELTTEGMIAYQEIIQNVCDICEKNYSNIINKQLVKAMVDNLKKAFPGIADGLVPEKISYLQLERTLQDMINEGKSIRDLIHILEDMEEKLSISPPTSSD